MILSSNPATTQYTEGDTDATITGTAAMMEVAANTLQPVQGTVADGLLVNLGTNNDVSVTGTVAVTQSGTWDEVGINDSGNSITVDDGAGSLTVDGTVAISGTVAVTQSGTWDEVGINDSGNSITIDNSTLSVVGGGTEATALRVTVASDSTGVLSVDDNGSSLTVDGTVAATQSGTWTEANSAAIAASLSVVDDWDESDRAKVNPIVGQAGVQGGSGTVSALTQRVVLATDVGLPTGTNTIGNVGTIATATSGGWDISRDIDLDEASASNVKASAGNVGGWYLFNNASSPRYVKLYNKATGPTVGSDTPKMTIGIPANSAANVEYSKGIYFDTGIGWAATTGVADADTGAPGANEVIGNLLYK